jgi:hypothetical protein
LVNCVKALSSFEFEFVCAFLTHLPKVSETDSPLTADANKKLEPLHLRSSHLNAVDMKVNKNINHLN